MGFRRFIALLSARNREFLRDRSAIAWNTLFPILIVMGFAFAFTTDDDQLFKVGVAGSADDAPILQPFLELEHIKFLPVDDLGQAKTRVERHQLDMLLDLDGARYWINATSANGYILERLLNTPAPAAALTKETLSGDEMRYVDWLIPGVLGMNVMFSALFGVGFVIVRYRKNGVLKRLKATPVSAFEFLSAQIVSRLWLIVLFTVAVYVGTDLFVGFRMYGSYLNLLLVLVVGAFSLISLGLIIAARMTSEETANGLLNLLSWPMMLLSGVWFSLEGSPVLVQQAALLLPLTHMIDAARLVMIDGAGFLDIAHHLLAMLAMTALFMTIGARTFRWE